MTSFTDGPWTNSSFFPSRLPDAKSVVRQHGGPVVGDGSPGDTTFYITLTIEQDEEEEDEDEETIGETGTKIFDVFRLQDPIL